MVPRWGTGRFPQVDGSCSGVRLAHQQPPDTTIDDRDGADLRMTLAVRMAGFKKPLFKV